MLKEPRKQPRSQNELDIKAETQHQMHHTAELLRFSWQYK